MEKNQQMTCNSEPRRRWSEKVPLAVHEAESNRDRKHHDQAMSLHDALAKSTEKRGIATSGTHPIRRTAAPTMGARDVRAAEVSYVDGLVGDEYVKRSSRYVYTLFNPAARVPLERGVLQVDMTTMATRIGGHEAAKKKVSGRKVVQCGVLATDQVRVVLQPDGRSDDFTPIPYSYNFNEVVESEMFRKLSSMLGGNCQGTKFKRLAMGGAITKLKSPDDMTGCYIKAWLYYYQMLLAEKTYFSDPDNGHLCEWTWDHAGGNVKVTGNSAEERLEAISDHDVVIPVGAGDRVGFAMAQLMLAQYPVSRASHMDSNGVPTPCRPASLVIKAFDGIVVSQPVDGDNPILNYGHNCSLLTLLDAHTVADWVVGHASRCGMLDQCKEAFRFAVTVGAAPASFGVGSREPIIVSCNRPKLSRDCLGSGLFPTDPVMSVPVDATILSSSWLLDTIIMAQTASEQHAQAMNVLSSQRAHIWRNSGESMYQHAVGSGLLHRKRTLIFGARAEKCQFGKDAAAPLARTQGHRLLCQVILSHTGPDAPLQQLLLGRYSDFSIPESATHDALGSCLIDTAVMAGVTNNSKRDAKLHRRDERHAMSLWVRASGIDPADRRIHKSARAVHEFSASEEVPVYNPPREVQEMNGGRYDLQVVRIAVLAMRNSGGFADGVKMLARRVVFDPPPRPLSTTPVRTVPSAVRDPYSDDEYGDECESDESLSDSSSKKGDRGLFGIPVDKTEGGGSADNQEGAARAVRDGGRQDSGGSSPPHVQDEEERSLSDQRQLPLTAREQDGYDAVMDEIRSRQATADSSSRGHAPYREQRASGRARSGGDASDEEVDNGRLLAQVESVLLPGGKRASVDVGYSNEYECSDVRTARLVGDQKMAARDVASGPTVDDVIQGNQKGTFIGYPGSRNGPVGAGIT